MIIAGKLDQRITFQRFTRAYDTVNQPIDTWGDAATVWAEVISEGGREFYAAQKKNAETTIVFRIRFTRVVNSRMRIKYGNRIFEILPPINDVNGRKTELLISAKEVV